jgi:hypothetical protein
LDLKQEERALAGFRERGGKNRFVLGVRFLTNGVTPERQHEAPEKIRDTPARRI